MSEYIMREAVMEFPIRQTNYDMVNGNEHFINGIESVLEYVENLPAADVVPVKHGRWECVYDDSTGETYITCSHCKNIRTVNGCFVSTDGKSCYFEDDYCPNCGAQMDGEEAQK